ncbi:hypothetical protein EDD16DRAFT_1517201 [Pisolithus croceorrhizus]|nr:hypothetical protein EV401DRAFT_1887505 [Pisolithus croceorrhizus]KAI6125410.1 hypothetical protein EDD16DRAFT_1517201 [Pisolithus croceorrhizus]
MNASIFHLLPWEEEAGILEKEENAHAQVLKEAIVGSKGGQERDEVEDVTKEVNWKERKYYHHGGGKAQGPPHPGLPKENSEVYKKTLEYMRKLWSAWENSSWPPGLINKDGGMTEDVDIAVDGAGSGAEESPELPNQKSSSNRIHPQNEDRTSMEKSKEDSGSSTDDGRCCAILPYSMEKLMEHIHSSLIRGNRLVYVDICIHYMLMSFPVNREGIWWKPWPSSQGVSPH